MRIRALILTGSVVLAMSVSPALAKKGKHDRGRDSGYFQLWIEGGWGQRFHDHGWGEPWEYRSERGLPPGLAKRDRLPPGLEKHLWKHGSLPPGLQKKLDPHDWKVGKKQHPDDDY